MKETCFIRSVMISQRQALQSLVIVMLLFLVGCETLWQEDYIQPESIEKVAWKGTIPDSQEVIRPDWWAEFGDDYLNQLVARAIEGDLDLRMLATRIEVAAIAIGAEKASALPKVTSDVSQKTQLDPDGTTETYSATANSSWEVDIWGRVRKGLEAKEAEFHATEADWRAGYLKLVADVSTKYFEIRKLDHQWTQQKRAINRNNQILAIFRQQLKAGLVSKSKVLQQQAETHSMSKELLELKRQRDVAEQQLASLLGVAADDLAVPARKSYQQVLLPQVPVGLPSTLLSRRPDIIASEYRVLAAYQLLGQVRLEQLPKFSLTADGGVSSSALSKLLKQWTLGLSPSFSIPIFDPTIKTKIRSNEAQVKLAEDEYRKKVIQAFEEVETTLINLSSRKQQRQSLELQVDNLKLVASNVNAQLQEGLVSQLEVFEVERTLLAARKNVLQIDQSLLADTLKLYKALGGGWPETEVR